MFAYTAPTGVPLQNACCHSPLLWCVPTGSKLCWQQRAKHVVQRPCSKNCRWPWRARPWPFVSGWKKTILWIHFRFGLFREILLFSPWQFPHQMIEDDISFFCWPWWQTNKRAGFPCSLLERLQSTRWFYRWQWLPVHESLKCFILDCGDFCHIIFLNLDWEKWVVETDSAEQHVFTQVLGSGQHLSQQQSSESL